MTKRRHDLMRGATRIRQAPAKCLSQHMRLAVQTQSGLANGITHELRKSGDGKGLSELGIEDRHMAAIGGANAACSLSPSPISTVTPVFCRA